MLAARLVPVLAILGALLAGCSPAEVGSTTTVDSTSSGTTTSARAVPVAVDLSRIGEIAPAFPAEYPARNTPRVGQLDARQAERVGDLVGFGKPMTSEPSGCRTLLAPVIAHAGASTASITSVEDVMAPFIEVSAYDRIDVATSLPRSGCDRFRFTVAGAVPDGIATRLTAPHLEDATTYALRLDFDVTNPASTVEPTVEFFYNAIVGNSAYVCVWARVPADFVAEPMLIDLLTRAVTAIRS